LILGAAGFIDVKSGFLDFIGGSIVVPASAASIFRGASNASVIDVIGADLSGGETNVTSITNSSTPLWVFKNCRFPASHTLAAGTISRRFRIEAYGCGETASGITTSEQALEISSHEGTVDLETVKVRTGGATDSAAGAYSHDFTTIAGNTTEGYNSLYGPWMGLWVAGDGTSKTLTVYFTSDSGNTRGTDWDDDEVWLEVLYPDDAGGSKFDYQTLQMELLDTAVAVTDDTGSTWGAGTARDQKLQATIAPDYEGPVHCRVHFAPGANAETIYVDPLPEVT
jgi:hypothetical protein